MSRTAVAPPLSGVRVTGARGVNEPSEPLDDCERTAVAPPRPGVSFTGLCGVNEPSEPLLPRDASRLVPAQESKPSVTSATGAIDTLSRCSGGGGRRLRPAR